MGLEQLGNRTASHVKLSGRVKHSATLNCPDHKPGTCGLARPQETQFQIQKPTKHRNLAVWCSPPALGRNSRKRVLQMWIATGTSELAEDPPDTFLNFKNVSQINIFFFLFSTSFEVPLCFEYDQPSHQ